MTRGSAIAVAAACAALVACSDRGSSSKGKRPPADPKTPASAVVTIVGTNDLHGNLDRLPVLAGYVNILRRTHQVVLVDAGDMYHGTMESNLNEGEAVIKAYNLMRYDAAAIGNHDFDFGPIGHAVEARDAGNPRGALEARVREAAFPLLCSNLTDAEGQSIGPPLVEPVTIVERAGVRVGVIGVATEEMPWVVRPSHFDGLRVTDPATAIELQARALRERGVDVVVVAAHAGGRCQAFDDPTDLSSCETDDEVFRIARKLPAGLVDVMIGGHKHGGIGHLVNGIAIIEGYSRGRAFGRVDVKVAGGRVVGKRIHPPRELCEETVAKHQCTPGRYEGVEVTADTQVAQLLAADIAAARTLANDRLGVEVAERLPRSQTNESAVGNLLVDLMMTARPGADLALSNGGALRADIPAGPMTYGDLYEAMSFDNRFAVLTVSGRELRRDLAEAFRSSKDMVSVSGVTVEARCEAGAIDVVLRRPNGAVIGDDEHVRVLTSDYLAIGGDGLFSVDTLRACSAEFEDGIIRDGMANALRHRGGTLRVRDVYDTAAPRVVVPNGPPVACE